MAAAPLSRKRKITPDRLRDAGMCAAERAARKVGAALKLSADAIAVRCNYEGAEDDETNLHCMVRVKYVWATPCGCLDHWALACKALHAGGFRAMPWDLKLPLIASYLPLAITEH